VQEFVTRFAAAWAARDGKAFLDLWHPEGSLHTPLVNRRVAGSELGRLLEVQTAAAPDFVWQLLDWTSRGDVIVIEWQTTRNVNGVRFEWRGVDKFRITDGRIIEERVYIDTAPLRHSARARRWSRSRSFRLTKHDGPVAREKWG
jgi:ketosteroid isomerase-like protein